MQNAEGQAFPFFSINGTKDQALVIKKWLVKLINV